MLCGKLRQEIRIMRVHGLKKLHNLENGWNGNRRPGQSSQMPRKPRPNLIYPLFITLSVIEEGKKGGEQV